MVLLISTRCLNLFVLVVTVTAIYPFPATSPVSFFLLFFDFLPLTEVRLALVVAEELCVSGTAWLTKVVEQVLHRRFRRTREGAIIAVGAPTDWALGRIKIFILQRVDDVKTDRQRCPFVIKQVVIGHIPLLNSVNLIVIDFCIVRTEQEEKLVHDVAMGFCKRPFLVKPD